MSAESYLATMEDILRRIRETQADNIKKSAQLMAESIAQKRVVHVFGSGHSVIPVLDIFPRYGSFVGFHPLLDPRLMWFNVLGPGGVRELLWLERTEGYIKVFLGGYHLDPRDTLLVFSHGGLNAAPLEMSMEAKSRGLSVVAVTSVQNQRIATATHSSGKKLAEVADVVIDNCVPAEDALVTINGWAEKVAAGSTVAVTSIAMALVAEVARSLAARRIHPPTFVSPNVKEIGPEHNLAVFEAHSRMMQDVLEYKATP
ncbi:MAG: SIS domain-containing protein [Chloroflexi bacterium]|nr:SIS domain-containing protein [Chloroflexota bacterium]